MHRNSLKDPWLRFGYETHCGVIPQRIRSQDSELITSVQGVKRECTNECESPKGNFSARQLTVARTWSRRIPKRSTIGKTITSRYSRKKANAFFHRIVWLPSLNFNIEALKPIADVVASYYHTAVDGGGEYRVAAGRRDGGVSSTGDNGVSNIVDYFCKI